MTEDFDPTKAAAGLKAKRAKISEKKIEAHGKAWVAATGGLSYKFVSPGHRSVPDQIELYGAVPLMRALDQVTGMFRDMPAEQRHNIGVHLLRAAVQFTEYKAPGKKPTAEQLREHERLRALGFTVNVIDHI